MLCEGSYKYIRNLVEGETEELYDLKNDPNELTNLALDPVHRSRVTAMRVQAIAELRRTDAALVDQLPAVRQP
jgi:arylsulfatase A-like enzyme